MKRVVYYLAFLAAAVTLAVLPFLAQSELRQPQPTLHPTPIVEPPGDRVVTYLVQTGDTFGQLAEIAGVPGQVVRAVLEAAEPVHPFTQIRDGRPLRFTFRPSGDEEKLIAVSYEISSEEILEIRQDESNWRAERQPIVYEVTLAKAMGTITSSLYETILEQGHDQRLAIALAEIFAWQVDFAVDVQAGDTYQILYERRFRDGQYVRPGNILKAVFTNAGTTYSGYTFTEGTTDGYFDADGRPLQRVFLKSPLTYRYVSSGYTGKRWDPISKKITAHYAIDYAARTGTPTVAVGDGTVTQAGWNGGYGISITLHHNATYTTRYGHFSRLAKGIRPGVTVKQNQVIGFVGSTGHSTGPHLHYEMYKYGTKVNPFTVDVPSGDPIPSALHEAFETEVKRLDAVMPKEQF